MVSVIKLTSVPGEFYLSSKYPIGGKAIYKNVDENTSQTYDFDYKAEFYNHLLGSTEKGNYILYLAFYRKATENLLAKVPSNKFALQLSDYSLYASKEKVDEDFEPLPTTPIAAIVVPIVLAVIIIPLIVWLILWSKKNGKCCWANSSAKGENAKSLGKKSLMFYSKLKEKNKTSQQTPSQFPKENNVENSPINQNPLPTLPSSGRESFHAKKSDEFTIKTNEDNKVSMNQVELNK